MINSFIPDELKRLAVFFAIASLLCGCSLLAPSSSPPPNLYTFDSASVPAQTSPAASVKFGAPTIIVNIPHAAAGFTTHQMIYVQQTHKLEHFRLSEWVIAPAAMLSPLITRALERSGQFGAVLQSPTSAVSQMRLEVEIVRLQQEFFSVPSRVHFTLRAHLLDTATHQVIAWREFDNLTTSVSDDPYGGVIAANIAVRTVITELADFCTEVSSKMEKPGVIGAR